MRKQQISLESSRDGEPESAVKTAPRTTLALPRVRPEEPAAAVIRAALQGAVARVQAADPEARRGDVEGIHRLRAATRRLRSELRTVQDLVDPRWREQLEEELKWLAGMLGSVRDLDILCQRLRAAVVPAIRHDGAPRQEPEECPEDALRPLFDALCERHCRNFQALRDALQSNRYRNLLVTIEQSSQRPALRDEASEPCRTALPPLASAAWRRLKKRARALKPTDPDADFHEVRKRAKRARYTAELIAPALGKRGAQKAARFIRLTTRVQDVLGEHQDAIVAATEVEQFLAEHPQDPSFARAAAGLVGTQRQAALAARTRFFGVWDKLDRKKSLRWFHVKPKAGA